MPVIFEYSLTNRSNTIKLTIGIKLNIAHRMPYPIDLFNALTNLNR